MQTCFHTLYFEACSVDAFTHWLIFRSKYLFCVGFASSWVSVCLSCLGEKIVEKLHFSWPINRKKVFFSCSSSKNLLTSFTGKTLRVSCCVFYSFKRSVNVLWTLAFIKKIPTNSSVFFQELFRFLSLFLAKL